MAALLSYLAEKDLLPTEEQLTELLRIIVDAGAVDAISAKQDTTVDGLAPFWEQDVYSRMRQLAAKK